MHAKVKYEYKKITTERSGSQIVSSRLSRLSRFDDTLR